MSNHTLISDEAVTVTAPRATGGTAVAVNGGRPGNLTFPAALPVVRSGSIVTILNATAWAGQVITVAGTADGASDADLIAGDQVLSSDVALVTAAAGDSIDAQGRIRGTGGGGGGGAPLDSPAFTGVPTAPTATVGTNTTQLATTAFVHAAIKTVYLSTTATSDAAGAIGYGATAPTGADQTSAVQAAVNAAAGGILIWDVAVGLSAPILLPSNITIEAPSKACGAILRAAADCPMFRLAGMANDVSTSKQNTFGKIDPAHSGDVTRRIFDSAFVNNRGITLKGGTWNGNKAQQTGNPFTTTYGFGAIVQFYGCEDITLDGCLFLRPLSALPVHFINWHKVTIRDCEIDCSPNPLLAGVSDPMQAIGGFQIDGPGYHLRMYDPITHCSDDNIALCPDVSTAAAINSSYAGGSGCTLGVNYGYGGDITDVRVHGHKIGLGAEGTVPFGCVRLLSTTHLLDDVIIAGSSGQTQAFAFTIGGFPAIQFPGPGNMGRIDIVDCAVELSNAFNGSLDGTGVFEIRGSAESIRILDRKRGDLPSSPVPDVNLVDLDSVSPAVRSLVLTGDYDSTTSNTAPIIKCSIAVDSIHVAARNRVPTGIASPVLLTAAGANIGLFDFAGDLNGGTNVVKYAGGSVYGTALRGSHRNAGGGSPVDIATGLSLTYAWYKDLAYNHLSVPFQTGAGTIAHDNDYFEAGATVYILDQFTAANGTAISGRTPAPNSPGANWAVLEGAGAQQTIQANAAQLDATSAVQSAIVDCGHADGTITVTHTLGTIGATGGGLFLRVLDANNFWVLWNNGNGNAMTLYRNVAGATTDMGHLAITPDTGPHALKAVLAGTSISVYYDGAIVAAVTDSFNSTATKHGIRSLSAISAFDNFEMTA